MIRVAQHQKNGTLFDLAEILRDLPTVAKIDSWHYDIETCVWLNGAEVPETTYRPGTISHDQFGVIFHDLSQTIDGMFRAFSDGRLVATFEAVDSTYWDIAALPAVEGLFAHKYDLYDT